MLARVFLLVAALLWAYLSVIGVSGYCDIIDQGVPGYPNNSQIYLYIILPIAMFLLAVTGIYFYNSTKYKSIIGFSAFIFVISSFPYILIAGGGV